MFRFANYVFGTEVDSNSDNENIDLNQCIEQDIDDDWILIDVPLNDKHKKSFKANDSDTKELPSNAANYETTTKRVPQTLNITDAQQTIDTSDHSDDMCPNSAHTMEESWFVTPPPCFNSLSQPIMIETTPLENLLIEHPSMSVFGPSLPFIDHQLSHSSQLPTDMSSNELTHVSTQPQSRRQLRQLRRQQQQQLIAQNRHDNQMNINLHLRSAVLDELHALNEMQTKQVSQTKKLLTKSSMDRQNKVLVQRNRPQDRRSKMAVKPNGIYNNRNKC